MTSVAIEQAERSLAQLIDVVARGEHVLITKDRVPVAELVPANRSDAKPAYGSAKGMIATSDDFDAPVDDFQGYMG